MPKEIALTLLSLALLSTEPLPQDATRDLGRLSVDPGDPAEPGCKYFSREEWMAELRRAVASGEVPDRERLATPALPRGEDRSPFLFGRVPCVTTSQIHVFEDPDVGLDLDLGQVFDLMARAANDAIATHGDVFDFVGYFVSQDPDWGFATAFYLPLFNDVQGLGDPLVDDRAAIGLQSQRVQGMVMMHGIDSGIWAPGNGPDATNTRLILAHEFGHRWSCSLPPLLDGRTLQGGLGCSSSGHWDFRVDNQASCLYLQEYVGSSPAVRDSTFGAPIDFNRDTGGAWAFLELYLMGVVSAAELDGTELRYLDAGCQNNEPNDSYSGPISTFSSADIVAAAGPRVPDAASAQRRFRVAWIMLQAPDTPATQRQLDDMAGIMRQQMLDWNAFTLGRSTLDVTLFDQCSDLQAYSCQSPIGSLQVLSGSPKLGDTLVFGIDNPFGTQAPGALPVLTLSLAADPNFPCGTLQSDWGMNGPGEVLIEFSPGIKLRGSWFGPPWAGTGNPAPVPLGVPLLPALVGTELFAQGALLEPLVSRGLRIGLTDAIRVTIGP